MSDRVARLAEIRRKRKAQEAGLSENPNNAVASVEVREALTEESGSSHLVSEGLNEKSKTDAIDEEDKTEKIRGNKLEETFEGGASDHENQEASVNSELEGEALTEEEPEEKKLTYNSDFKRDLAPFLERAKLDTDRAVNRILQEKYQKAVRANFDEAK